MNDSTRRTFLASAAVAAISAVASGQEAKPAAGGKPITILGFSFSHRKGKGTATALRACLDAAQKAGVEVELIEVAGMNLHAELAAGVPLGAGQQDDFAPLAAKISDPKVGGIIFASPVYFGSMSSLCKAFLERCTIFHKGFALRNKVAGCISVAGNRNGGQELTIQGIQTALHAQDMLVVGDGKPTSHLGATLWNGAEGVTKDAWGMETAANLGKRVAELAIKMAS